MLYSWVSLCVYMKPYALSHSIVWHQGLMLYTLAGKQNATLNLVAREQQLDKRW